MTQNKLSGQDQGLLNLNLNLKPAELDLFITLQELMEDNFTGSITLHLSEGEVRKVETTEVQRFGN